MDAIEFISQDLFDKIRSRFSNLEMGDEGGNVTMDPKKARFFDFDFVVEGESIGSVSVSINERGALKIFFSKGLMEDQDPMLQEVWYNFLKDIRMFAKRRLLRFDTRDITKDNLNKNDFKFLSLSGSQTMSEQKMVENRNTTRSTYRTLDSAKVVLRHRKPIVQDMHGARSRSNNIESIFIQNKLGERYKMPINSIRAAEAMARHVANGGIPHDSVGKQIVEMASELEQLKEFDRRAPLHDTMHSEVHEIVEKTRNRIEYLKDCLNKLSKQSHYESWKNNLPEVQSDTMVMDQATMENYKSMFTVSSFKEELAQYFPLIHKIMQETGEVDLNELVSEDEEKTCNECGMAECSCDNSPKELAEVGNYDEWATNLIDKKLTSDQINQLKEIVKQNIKVGLDGVNAAETLDNLKISNEDLDKLINDAGAEGDFNTVLTIWLTQNDDKNALNQLGLEQQDNEEAKSTEPKPANLAKPAAAEPAAAPAPTAPPAAAPAPPAPLPESGDTGKEPPPRPKMKKPRNYQELVSEVAKMVKSFYNREENNFPLGEAGVATKIEHQFSDFNERMGQEARRIAERMTRELSSHLSNAQPVKEDLNRPIMIDGKEVDRGSIEFNLDTLDAPDFADPHITSAEFTDGTPLSDVQLDQLSGDEYGDVIHHLADMSLRESDDTFVQMEDIRRLAGLKK